ncbi:ATP-dependent DNA helicase [Spirochaetia bacterium]|nr:ATP-dependent DNA helicase [Spirochaetia bacterium]
MIQEDLYTEKKSLRIVTGKTANWKELAKECVGFANARGGTIIIGIEDNGDIPPEDQQIDPQLPAIIQRRIAELTINTGIVLETKMAKNDSSFIVLKVLQSQATIASTTDGQYYYRLSDSCMPLPPDELMRLLTDKPSFIWETKPVRTIFRNNYDPQKMEDFVFAVRNSERVSPFVKQKNNDELLDYYLMADSEYLTNLGVLWVGRRSDRAKLSYAPVIQFLKYDENENRVNKIVWDDFSLNPAELIEAVWTQIPDWKEGVEISDGLFRRFISNYEEEVIRELITNALVHHPYTTRGDIFINMYPNCLEIHNPGSLPIGVTPSNILHKTVRRNDKLAQIFYDLKLMEREGSGYDKIYETLLVNGKQPPEIKDIDDRVQVIINKKIIKPEIISLLSRINDEFQLNQKEIICLSLLAQHTTLSALELAKTLGLPGAGSVKQWVGKLPDYGIINSRGKAKGTEYFIRPQILQRARFKGKTTLKRIEGYRLTELIFQDLSIYPNSSVSEINERIGKEIKPRQIKFAIDKMREKGTIKAVGKSRWTRYSINNSSSNKSGNKP